MGDSAWGRFQIHTASGGGLYAGTDSGSRFTPTQTGGNVYEAGKWTHISFTYDSPIGALYKNGQLLCSKTGMNQPSAWTGGFDLSTSLDGIVDEMRVSSVPRSSNWVWASFCNMESNDVFAVTGAPEWGSIPVVGESGWATNVTPSGAWLNGTLSSTGTSATTVFAFWGPTDGGTNESAWANTNTWYAPQMPGDFTIQATDLSADSTYCYRFAASNAMGWAWAPQASVFITGEVWLEKISDASEIGPTPGTFTVHRASAATNAALIVTYTVGGTATPGVDYMALRGTITIPQDEQSAMIEVLSFFDHFVEGPETVVVSLAPGPYMLGASSSASVNIADYGIVTAIWNGGGVNALASNPANWASNNAPIAGDAIMLNATNSKNMTWDLNIPVQSWTQDGYTGTVTIATVYPGQGAFTNFTILGDCVISNGVWTQIANSGGAIEKELLRVTIGGNLVVGPDAAVNVSTKGYAAGRGSGAPSSGNWGGGSYGGRGGLWSSDFLRPCYGNTIAPTNLGSGGGHTSGGGAIRMDVAGSILHDGLFAANGTPSTYHTGSGGSIYLVAGSLGGKGSILANGGIPSGGHGPGGGGRIALVVTHAGADFSTYTGMRLALGRSADSSSACGTIYLEKPGDLPGKGELILDNGGTIPLRDYYTALGDVPSTQEFSRIVLTNNANLSIGSGSTLIVTNTELSVTGPYSGFWISGGTWVVPPVFAYSNFFIGVDATGSTFSPTTLIIGTNAEFRVDVPHVMNSDLIVKAGGLLTHTPNPAVNKESYKIDLTMDGSLIVEEGGGVDVSGRGFPANVGPGTHPFANNGASYGGIGSGGISCYGSLTAPTNLGSGGRGGVPGGGAILLTLSGVVSNGGIIRASGRDAGANTGSGGSIYIRSGKMIGSGAIQANSSALAAVNPGGGGRIALVVTNMGADFSGYTLTNITAFGCKYAALSGGAGTVYLRTAAQGPTEGTLLVDNDNWNGRGTEISANVTDTTVANVLIQRSGNLLLNTNQTLTVSVVWSNTASFMGLADSAVVFGGMAGSTSTIYGATTFRGLTCTNAGKTLQFEAHATNAVAAYGRLILRGDAATNLILRSTVADTAWHLNVDALTEQDIEFVDVANSDAEDGAEIIAKNSVGAEQNNVHWKFLNVTPGETIVWTGNDNTLWTGVDNWDRPRAPVETDVVVIPGGCPNYPVFDAARTVNQLEIQAGGTVYLNGYDLTVTHAATIRGSLIAAGTETVTLLKDADFSEGEFQAVRSAVVVAGDVAQSINLSGLTFYKVRVDNSAATVTLSGGFTATELRCEAPSGARSLAFEAGKTVTLRDLVLRGASPSATNILLRSTADGQKWKLVVSGYRSVSGVNVKDSDASVGLPIPALASEDGGNNANWQFGVAPALWLGTSGNNFHTAANWDPAVVPDAATRVLVEGANPMTVTGAVSILDLTVGGGVDEASVTVNDVMTVGESVSVLEKGTLAWNKPGVVSNDLIVSGGLLTHSINGATEANKIDLTVFHDVAIDTAGKIDVNGKGYAIGNGPGKTGSGINFGGSAYGGRGAIYGTHLPGLCYGSIVAPTNLGSGGGFSAGGGAILVKASGTIRNDGLLCADGAPTAHYQGSGGTVFLTAGTIFGIGTIRANGGDMTGFASAAGGGRIALVVTNEGADFSAYTGLVQARSTVLLPAGSDAKGAGPGTIYRQTAADRPGRGTVTLDNDNLTSSGYAAVPSYTQYVLGEVNRAVFHVANAAQLRLTNNFTVGDIWLDSANAVLDFGGYTLTVNAREHELGLGNVVNPGAILWTGLPPGVLIILK